MASNGLLISSSKGNPYVVAAASSHWEQMDKYYVEGPAVEQQEINFKGNKAEAGVSVFQTNLSKGGCESSEIEMCIRDRNQSHFKSGCCLLEQAGDKTIYIVHKKYGRNR